LTSAPSTVIGIVSYGVGNLTSVCNSLQRVGVSFEVVESPERVARHTKLLLPGVGAFAAAAGQLRARNLDQAIVDAVRTRKTQVLGICLGMQLLFDGSTENGWHTGLGLVPGTVEFLGGDDRELRVPHMGWNSVAIQPTSRLLAGCGTDPDFYFVHSYACVAQDRAAVTGTCNYGRGFDAVIEEGPIMGCQFHPEKSQRHGLRVLRNFAEIPC
jgi:glutamine amidotransferase